MNVESQSITILPDERIACTQLSTNCFNRSGEMNTTIYNVINAINEIMHRSSDLKAKPKHRFLLGSSHYRQVHRTCYDHIRIASIQPQYEGCNSLLLTPYKLLLSIAMYACCCGIYDEEDYERFNDLQSDLEAALYNTESDSD